VPDGRCGGCNHGDSWACGGGGTGVGAAIGVGTTVPCTGVGWAGVGWAGVGWSHPAGRDAWACGTIGQARVAASLTGQPPPFRPGRCVSIGGGPGGTASGATPCRCPLNAGGSATGDSATGGSATWGWDAAAGPPTPSPRGEATTSSGGQKSGSASGPAPDACGPGT
jgi:hypothetical protein